MALLLRDKNSRLSKLFREASYGEPEAVLAHHSFVRAVRLKHRFRELWCNFAPIIHDVLVGEFEPAFVAGLNKVFLRLPKRYPQL